MDKKLSEYDTLDYLRNDVELQKEYISELLNEYIKDNNADTFLSALKPLIELNGSISAFAKKTELTELIFINFSKKK